MQEWERHSRALRRLERERNLRASRHLQRAMHYMGFGETCADVKNRDCGYYNVGTDCMLNGLVRNGKQITDHHNLLLKNRCHNVDSKAVDSHRLECVNSRKGCVGTKDGWFFDNKESGIVNEKEPSLFNQWDKDDSTRVDDPLGSGGPTQEQLMKMSERNAKDAVKTGNVWEPEITRSKGKIAKVIVDYLDPDG